ncbi:MAG: DegT/DnrJ/EryC1/StrS family aminotransferase, partial [Candidatus Omnitrophota bacterium]
LKCLYQEPLPEIRTDAGAASSEAKKARGPVLYTNTELEEIKTDNPGLKIHRDLFLAGVEFAAPRDPTKPAGPHIGFIVDYTSFVLGEILKLTSLREEVVDAYVRILSELDQAIHSNSKDIGAFSYIFNNKRAKMVELLSPRAQEFFHQLSKTGFKHIIEELNSKESLDNGGEDLVMAPKARKRIMLIQPGFSWQVNKPTRMPLGAMSLASALRDDNLPADVSIIDMVAEQLDLNGLIERIDDERPDVIGVSVVSVFFNVARDIARKIKGIYPDILLVAGGPHVSALAEYTLRVSDFDVVVRNEGEAAFVDIVSRFSERRGFENIEGISYKHFGRIISTPTISNYREWVMAADSLDLLRLDRYDEILEGGLVYPIMATRGCPYNKCAFCGVKAVFNCYRRRLPESVVDEIEFVYYNYGIRFFHFLDDTMTADHNYAERIYTLIIERNLDINWMGMTRADAIVKSLRDNNNYGRERGLLELAKRSGCVGFAIGVESGDPKILELIDKKLDLSILAKSTELIKEAGIHVKYFLIAGIPGQDNDSINRSIDVINENKPDSINVTVVKPLPGSELFDLWLTIARRQRNLLQGQLLSQEEVMTAWEELKRQSSGVQIGIRRDDYKDLDELWDKLMFEEEPGLKGTFSREKLFPIFETQEMTAAEVLEHRQMIFDAYKRLTSQIKRVPVFRRPFSSNAKTRVQAEMRQLLESEQFEMGHYTVRFENEFAARVGTKYALGVSNGTNGLELALRASFGSLEGRSIIVGANTNIADVSSIIHAGAKVVLCDVKADTFSLDPQRLRILIEQEGKDLNIAGIIVVHMGGLISPDIQEIQNIALENDLFLLEDASHAYGSVYKGIPAGNFGDAAVFSLFATKMLTSFNGGVIVTNDEQLYGKMHSYRSMGRIPQMRQETYDTNGGNYRMDEMQAIVARADLSDFEERVARRRRLAQIYDSELKSREGVDILKADDCQSNYYKYVIVVNPRLHPDFDYNYLRVLAERQSIGMPGLIYGYSLDSQRYPEGRLYIDEAGISVAQELTDYHVALPIHEEMRDEDAILVASIINDYLGSLASSNLNEAVTEQLVAENQREIARPRKSYYYKQAESILRDHLHTQQLSGRGVRFALETGDIVRASAGVRIPFSSCIASDRVAVSLAQGGRVINMAASIDGEKPISVSMEVLSKPVLIVRRVDANSQGQNYVYQDEIRSLSEVISYSNLDDRFRLMKMVLLASGLLPLNDERELREILTDLGGGLKIETYHNVSQGGGSSNVLSLLGLILINRLLGRLDDMENINNSVVLIEYLAGSLGGWQDHLGSYYPGLKELRVSPGAIFPNVETLILSEKAKEELSSRLILWDSTVNRDSATNEYRPVLQAQTKVFGFVDRLRRRAYTVHERMKEALLKGDMKALGRLLTEKYNLAKLTSPNVRTDYLDTVIAEGEQLIEGASSIGTGGGGYSIFIACEGKREELIKLLNKHGRVHEWSLDTKGVEVNLDAARLRSLKDRNDISDWIEAFDFFAQKAKKYPDCFEHVEITFSGGEHAIDFDVYIPKNIQEELMDIALKHISTQISNRLITKGATAIGVETVLEGFKERLKTYFEEHYDNSGVPTSVSQIAARSLGSERVVFGETVFSGDRVRGDQVPAAYLRDLSRSATIVGINIGKSMTKVGIATVSGFEGFNYVGGLARFMTWPNGASRSEIAKLARRVALSVNRKLQQAGLSIDDID